MQRGEIRLHTFKPPDKRRPVVVLTRDEIIPHLNHVTVAAITTTVRGIPTEVRLDLTDGMKQVGAVNVDHIYTLPKEQLGPVISHLGADRLDQIRNAVLFAFGFD